MATLIKYWKKNPLYFEGLASSLSHPQLLNMNYRELLSIKNLNKIQKKTKANKISKQAENA